ncbi:MAG: molybdenum ABC transporter ATP-binding protein [Chromatiales bacterium]|nr:molybdenum ABC transporter ATP-binding protein [Chromatiales bacterium]MDP6149770.1 molybdenum ABC transporter ATP-binding protein [Gammaproteobacteria bacterium]MDP7094094.1 molybdenum ABC transporter ATP-binding protein [Gammaproteobacteria bacterium]HJP04128.1 molybdenum ABC transporter ATP-binding protein [Gammaproteobacteria bacterium]
MSIRVAVTLARPDYVLDARFDAPPTGITAVFGPSGAGKSTLLRIIAGLEPGEGEIQVGQEQWLASGFCRPAHERPVGYVFQEASLFEHLSVAENLNYGYRRVPDAERIIDFDHVTEVLRLGELLQRRPATLSGGERQRVAIGRALLTSPKLLLMDEPLASLDLQHQREIMPFLENLCSDFGIPAIYVSHVPEEVAQLADQLVLIDKGKVTAAGPVNEILTRFDLPMAHDHDAGAVIDTTPGEFDSEFGLQDLVFAGGQFIVPGTQPATGGRRVRVLARDVSLALEKHTDTSILNILPAQITEISKEPNGQSLVKLDAGGSLLLARVTRRSTARMQLEPGKQVFAQIKTVALLN